MVTERSSVETDEQPLDKDGLPPLEIVDGTSEDNLAKERAFDAGEEVESVVHTDTIGSTDEGSEDKPEQGSADVDAQKPADTETPTPVAETEEVKAEGKPESRVFSEDEVSKMRSTNDRRYSELELRVQAAERREQETAQKADLERGIEAELSQQERTLSSSLGEEEAKKVVRDNNNIATVRRSLEAVQQNTLLTQALQQQAQQTEEQAKFTLADKLAALHKVTTDDLPILVTAGTPEAMVKLAERLGGAAEATGKSVAERRAQVPPENQETTLESGHSTAAPTNEQKEIDRLMTLPASEWGEEGEKLMRAQAGI